MGQYTNIATVPLFRDSDYHNGLREKLFSERGPRPRGTTPDWWLREKVEMVDGELVGDADGDGIGDIVPVSQFGNGRANVTRWVKRDANGDRWPQWKISYDFDNGMDDPAFDVWYFDATNYNVRSKGFDRGVAGMDFSGGRTEDIEKINSAWRKGYRKAWKRLEELRPDMYIIGNHDWYNYADPETGALPPNNGFTKRIHGGLLEDVMRPKGGPEQKFGWGQIYDWYRFSMGYFRKPGLTYFSVTGDLTHSTAIDGTADNPTAADYQWFRYTFGTCLLQNGYYVYGAADYPSGSSLWFDEYDRAGQDDTSWMGVGIDGPGTPVPRAPWLPGNPVSIGGTSRTPSFSSTREERVPSPSSWMAACGDCAVRRTPSRTMASCERADAPGRRRHCPRKALLLALAKDSGTKIGRQRTELPLRESGALSPFCDC